MGILIGKFDKQPSDKPKVSREKAVEIAKLLYRHKHVRDVLLFGSVARDGVGEDIDIIIITDFERARQFLTVVDIVLPPRAYTHKRMRQEIASEVLEEHFADLLARAKEVAGTDLDILVFAPDWREHLEAIRQALHAEPAFIQSIVWDAISLITGKR
ncbi:MAG: hypothetical protein WAV50_01020 [Minisyncoccia bacterium]